MPAAHAPSRHVLRKQTRAISTALLARANVLPAYLENVPAGRRVAVDGRREQDALVAVAGVLAAQLGRPQARRDTENASSQPSACARKWALSVNISDDTDCGLTLRCERTTTWVE